MFHVFHSVFMLGFAASVPLSEHNQLLSQYDPLRLSLVCLLCVKVSVRVQTVSADPKTLALYNLDKVALHAPEDFKTKFGCVCLFRLRGCVCL